MRQGLKVKAEQLAQEVLDFARENYSHKSERWDSVLECWSQDAIAEDLLENKVFTKRGAIAHFREFARLQHEAYLNTEAHLHKEF